MKTISYNFDLTFSEGEWLSRIPNKYHTGPLIVYKFHTKRGITITLAKNFLEFKNIYSDSL